MPDDAAGVALTKVSSPFSKERGLDRERQVVRGVDLGAWSRDEAARPLRPPGGAPPPWEVGSDLLGRACLYAEKEGAPPRAGVVVDARHHLDRDRHFSALLLPLRQEAEHLL